MRTPVNVNTAPREAIVAAIDKLDLGKSVELTVPQLRPAEVDRHWGQIVLAKAESIDVQDHLLHRAVLAGG
ncbi:MAG TPA: hypothetical protein PKH09_15555, partial [Parvularculaceae bacterium]|nr:hypothetical protein [Parvularculaceae bacterium]